MNTISNAPQRVRILYVGRNAAAFDTLSNTILHSNGNSNGAMSTETIPWLPSIQFHMARNQREALHDAQDQPPHIVMVEVTGAPNSRLRFCETLRYRLPTAQIVAVSKNEVASPFPFDRKLNLPLERSAASHLLSSCIEALEGRQLQVGHIRLDTTRRTVQTHNGTHHMTPKQCALLRLFMINHGKVVERTDIMQTIWNTSYMEDTRTLDVHIRWLREHIEPEPSEPVYLLTARGVGYRLDVTEK